MKILLVDDNVEWVNRVVDRLRSSGLDITGLMPHSGGMETLHHVSLDESAALALVSGADVIFLDHNMPKRNGEQLLQYWRKSGLNMSIKRVVGISSDEQPYLSEKVGAEMLNGASHVKRFLGVMENALENVFRMQADITEKVLNGTIDAALLVERLKKILDDGECRTYFNRPRPLLPPPPEHRSAVDDLFEKHFGPQK